MILAGTTATAVIAVGAGLFFVYQTQLHSFDFQMAQAETKFSNKVYSEALKYVERALALNPESAEANILEAKIYLKEGNEEAALSILLSVTESHPDSTNAYGELLRLYEKNEEYEKIRELMNGASDSMKAKYQTYVCELPSVSKAGGSYSEELELRFDIPLGTRVYYTLDGSTPDSTSQEYEDAILLDEERTYKLKYFACNEKGFRVKSGKRLIS